MKRKNNLEGSVLGKLDRSGDFDSILIEENTIVLAYKDTTQVLVLQKNEKGLYDATYSRYTPEIKEMLEY